MAQRKFATQREFVESLPQPMFIPWGQSAVLNQGARILASRLANADLQGLAQWARQAFTKKAAMEAAKQLPRLVAEDALIDSLGNSTTGAVERYGDARGLIRTLRNGNPFLAGTDAMVTIGDPSYKSLGDFIKNIGIASSASAADFTPQEIDLSTQNIPATKRTDIRLNESLFDTPKVYGKDILYTTPLNPIEQKGFQAWLKTLPDYQRNGLDYDLQGYYKSARNGTDPRAVLAIGPSGAHLNDVRKTPFHPTFSNQSMYHGVDGWQGGNWTALNPEKTQ